MKGRNDTLLPLYGISQNPDTKDYIMVLQDESCETCGKQYILYKWCKICHIKNLISLSGNENIDNLIQEMQLKTHNPGTMVFEWIPYNQFNEIRETDKNGPITVYSAIWKDGPIYYQSNSIYDHYGKYTRDSNKEVILKCLNNSQNLIDFLINEV